MAFRKKSNFEWKELDALIHELAEWQRQKLLSCGKQIVPTVTEDDLLQPNDFPELENHPVFRYEEGILAGIQTVQMAFRARQNEQENKDCY